MLGRRRRRRPNINSTLGQRLLLEKLASFEVWPNIRTMSHILCKFIGKANCFRFLIDKYIESSERQRSNTETRLLWNITLIKFTRAAPVMSQRRTYLCLDSGRIRRCCDFGPRIKGDCLLPATLTQPQTVRNNHKPGNKSVKTANT